MVTRTFLKKYNTILKDSDRNFGLAPVSDMVFGKDGIYSRGLIYFDHNGLKEKYESGEMPDITKMKHTLKITNASSVNPREVHQCGISQITGDRRMRAASFDLIFFLIPKLWDGGKGFAYHDDLYKENYYPFTVEFDQTRLFSVEGSNWFNRRSGLIWENEGIYTNDFLSKEYDKFAAGEESVIIARQKFDIGNENIDVDITDTVNKFITGELENYGIGIAFTPLTELRECDVEQYVGFMTNHTPTFFEPFVETRYEDHISDDRSNFALNKVNRLYLYATVGGKYVNLDEIPTVTIVDSNDEVIVDINGREMSNVQAAQYSKGVYYVELCLDGSIYAPGAMIYDKWDNILVEGIKLPETELYTTIQPIQAHFSIGTSIPNSPSFTPDISGINEKEQIKSGDIRKLVIEATQSYTNNVVQIIDDIEIRLYVMDGTSEYDVISWDKVEKTYLENYYVLDTSMLVPSRYYIDIKIHYGMDSIVHHDVLQFDIVNDITRKTR